MTTYRSFAIDFPVRCRDLLTLLEDTAYARDREVTLLFAVASSAFVIPFERLRPLDTSQDEHPSEDRQAFPEASAALDDLLTRKLAKSCFNSHPQGAIPWRWTKFEAGSAGETPIAAFNREWSALKPTFTVGRFLKYIRNALAHGNVFVEGGSEAIQQIILLSRPYVGADHYEGLMCRPDVFRDFILSWISFLESCPFPTEAMPVFAMPLPLMSVSSDTD